MYIDGLSGGEMSELSDENSAPYRAEGESMRKTRRRKRFEEKKKKHSAVPDEEMWLMTLKMVTSQATSVKMKGMTKIPKVPEKKIRVTTKMIYVEAVTNWMVMWMLKLDYVKMIMMIMMMTWTLRALTVRSGWQREVP